MGEAQFSLSQGAGVETNELCWLAWLAAANWTG